MPHLTLPLSVGGPLLDVAVGVSVPRANALAAAGLPAPPAVAARGLIDTGASCTCVDPSILQQLNLQPTGTAQVSTPSTGATPHVSQQYDVSLTLIHPLMTYTISAVPVIESTLAGQGFHVLIGRDVLSHRFFAYDGRAQTFVLAF